MTALQGSLNNRTSISCGKLLKENIWCIYCLEDRHNRKIFISWT